MFVGEFKCLSFHQVTDWEEAAVVVKEFSNQKTYYPSAAFMNFGIHCYSKKAEETKATIQKFETVVNIDQAPTKYIFHSTTPIQPPAHGSNDAIIAYNDIVKSFFNTKNRKLILYLDFYAYALSLQGGFKASKSTCTAAKVPDKECTCKRFDGVHFERICNYAPLITQWDFNWLVKLNLIQSNTLS